MHRLVRRFARAGAVGLLGMVLVESLVLGLSHEVPLLLLTAACGIILIYAVWSVSDHGPRLRFAFLAGLLDLAAIVAGASLAAGNDAAVILPFFGAVFLVTVVRGRELALGMLAAWVTGIVASAVAFSTPGLSSIPNATPPVVAGVIAAVMTGFGYLVLGWVSAHWRAALDEARASAEGARRAELAAERAAQTLRDLAENSPLPMLAIDRDRHISAWNPAARKLLGWSEAEVLGRPAASFLEEEFRAGADDLMQRAFGASELGGPQQARLLRKEGGDVPVEVFYAAQADADGRPLWLVVQFLDLTERNALQERLVEAQRREAVEQLAGGVAHDFNNSLTAIAGFASLIASGDSPDPREDAQTIMTAAQRAASLTRQLTAFSRRVPLQPQLVDLRDFVHRVEPLVRSLVGETVAVRVETSAEPALVEVDPPSLERAILNMATNARDAMAQGGELGIVVRSVPHCRADDAAAPQPHETVIISDTGPGISPATLQRMFEPFFTTKPAGKGTGLGLAMVNRFVAQSGGHIQVMSPAGQGATFELHFPRAAGTLAQERGYTAPVGGIESILFVEDDPNVAAYGLACLRRLGYEVTPAMNGSDAAALAASRSEPFDLLFTDVVLPGMSGPELASLIHRRHPATSILYASGYIPEHARGSAPGPNAPLLEKPYSPEQLAAKVREVLEHRSSGLDRPYLDTRSSL